MAESQGYRATVEKEILVGTGKIDVALERGDEKIACEVSVTSTGEHEVGNVQKCIAAGYQSVVLIATEKKALTRIQEFISSRLEQELLKFVFFLSAEEFFSYLQERQTAAASTEQTIRGYRVKVNYQAAGEHQQKAKRPSPMSSFKLCDE